MDHVIAGLVISSFGKLLHTVMVIWDYRDMEFSYLINITVFTSNLEAIAGNQSYTCRSTDNVAIFNITYPKTALILGSAVLGKFAFQRLISQLDPSFPYYLL